MPPVQPPKFAYLNGEWVPFEKATLGLADHVVQYGTGAFGGIRVFANDGNMQGFRLDLHEERLRRDAALLGISRPEIETKGKLVELIGELVKREGINQDCYVRPLAYKGFNPSYIGVDPTSSKNCFGMFARVFSMDDYFPQDKALSLSISKGWEQLPPELRQHKFAGNYAVSALTKKEARERGFDDVLLPNQEGFVTEAHAANFFYVKGGVLFTPPAQHGLLPGITRRTIMELAEEELELEVHHKRVYPWQLTGSPPDEAFLCGTGVGVVAVKKIEDAEMRAWQERPVTRRIQNAYVDHIRGRCGNHKEWLTTVHEF